MSIVVRGGIQIEKTIGRHRGLLGPQPSQKDYTFLLLSERQKEMKKIKSDKILSGLAPYMRPFDSWRKDSLVFKTAGSQ